MKDNQAIHIAGILNNPGETFWALCGQGMQDQAREHGITLAIRPVLTSEEAQIEVADCLRQPHIDAVILVGTTYSLPNDATVVGVPPIPMINCNGRLHGMTAACELQPDLRRAATLAATYLVEQLQGQGFAAVVAQHPGVSVVVEAEVNWNRALAARAMQAALATHPDIRGVFAHSDAMALGAVEALDTAGRHDVIVVGIDAIPEALSAIHAGRMAATINSAPYALGRTAVTHALQIVQGRPTPAAVLTDVRMITADNLIEATLDTVSVLPSVLRDLIEGNQVQRRLQEEIIAAQRSLIQELSTPIIPVSDSILVVPLVGAIDTLRARQITETLLEAVGRQQTQVLIIDITGVAMVDTSVVNHLLQTARAARLLGTSVLLVGIGPEVAQVIVQLGIDLSSIVTRSTLQAGLEYARGDLRR
jgi:anti-anti-sigma factor